MNYAAAIVTDRNGHARAELIQVKDFYALPDLRPLEPQSNGAGSSEARSCRVCAGAEVGVPTARVGLSEVPGSAGRDGAGAAGLDGEAPFDFRQVFAHGGFEQ